MYKVDAKALLRARRGASALEFAPRGGEPKETRFRIGVRRPKFVRASDKRKRSIIMKIKVSMALRSAAFAAISAATASAFAFGGLFDGGLSRNIVSTDATAYDDSFFAGQTLTMGEMGTTYEGYGQSVVDGAYGECADCQGDALPAYDFATYDYGYSYGYVDSYGWIPARTFTPARSIAKSAFRGVGSVLRGIRNFLTGNCYDYCQPAYVCDPCWSFCDPCCDPCIDACCDWSPCAPCDACNPCEPACNPCEPACDPCGSVFNPNAVYAPRSCCGYGYAPGETRPLNPTTGRASEGGIDAQIDQKAPSIPKPQTTQSKAPVSPALPALDPNVAPAQVPGEDEGNALPTYQSEEPEEVPTPSPSTLGNGTIKMLVPEDAVVYVNGYRTKQKGAVRTFAAKNLQYGETYSFEIRVVAIRNGRVFDDVQTTTLTAGDSSALAFNLTLNENQSYAYNN